MAQQAAEAATRDHDEPSSAPADHSYLATSRVGVGVPVAGPQNNNRFEYVRPGRQPNDEHGTYIEDPTDYSHSHDEEEEGGALHAFVPPVAREAAEKRPVAMAQPAESENETCFHSITRIAVAACCFVVLVAIAAVSVSVALANKSGDSTTGVPKQGSGTTGCIRTTKELANALQIREDFNKVVVYTLCPSTVFTVDEQINPDRPLEGSRPPLVAHPNTHVKCGDNGAMSNGCVVTRGDALFIDSGNRVADNVVFEGVTFKHDSIASPKMIDLKNAGNITFRNCVFLVRILEDQNHLPILVTDRCVTPPMRQSHLFTEATIEMDYAGKDPPGLTVTFDGCIFHDMKIGKQTIDNDSRSASLIKVRRASNHLVLSDCVFRENKHADPAVRHFTLSYLSMRD